jgi:hypothetical protein
LENQPTLGSITTSESQRRHFAAISLENNCKNALFCKLFPELVTLHKKREEERAYLKALQEAARETLGHSPIDPTKPNQDTNDLMDTKKKKIKEVYQFIEENNVSILVGISILLFVLCAYLVLL